MLVLKVECLCDVFDRAQLALRMLCLLLKKSANCSQMLMQT